LPEHFKIAEWRILELERDYAPLNVRQELVLMNNWLEANPRRRKKQYNRFVINWLNSVYAKIATAQVKSRMMAQTMVGKPIYSADDVEFYEKMGFKI